MYICHCMVVKGLMIVPLCDYINFVLADFAEDSTQMTDYYGDFLSEETHM